MKQAIQGATSITDFRHSRASGNPESGAAQAMDSRRSLPSASIGGGNDGSVCNRLLPQAAELPC